ncbi:hypothetical protein [Neisseria weixii]|uniref:hypothetical protein n=1 Tax=Neisseria weixii TaxID=1853276 RepID=UPI0018DF0F87|nr:hypothetical protein [Neisseria weixii]
MRKLLMAAVLSALAVQAHAATAPDTLAKVMKNKELLVCSPGDYKPSVLTITADLKASTTIWPNVWRKAWARESRL